MLANLVPLGGVLFLGWSLATILFLYWLETAIVGFYNLIKLAMVAGPLSVFFVPFFVVHFGAFMAGHFVFLNVLFLAREAPVRAGAWAMAWGMLGRTRWAALSLLVSHGISFYHDFLGTGAHQLKEALDHWIR